MKKLGKRMSYIFQGFYDLKKEKKRWQMFYVFSGK